MTSSILPEGVRGWLTEREAQVLAHLATDQTVLEVGTFAGRSAIVMARVARRVYCVDTFHGDSETGWQDTLAEARDNFRRHGVADQVCLLIGDQLHLLPVLDVRQFGLVFYDAEHRCEATLAGLELLSRATQAVIAVHDYDRQPVQDAVGVWLARHGRQLDGVHDRLAVIRSHT